MVLPKIAVFRPDKVQVRKEFCCGLVSYDFKLGDKWSPLAAVEMQRHLPSVLFVMGVPLKTQLYLLRRSLHALDAVQCYYLVPNSFNVISYSGYFCY